MSTVTRSVSTVRHSATANNAAQVISGRLDEPISDIGRTYARELREKIGTLTADTIVASTASRAIETATLLTGVEREELVTSELCLERDYGVLQGIAPEAVKEYAAVIDYIEVGGYFHSLNPPGGESFESVRKRAEAFLDFVCDLPGRTVLVATHQIFLQQFHGMLLGMTVHESLALNIKALQIDRFDLEGSRLVEHTLVHPGMANYGSW